MSSTTSNFELTSDEVMKTLSPFLMNLIHAVQAMQVDDDMVEVASIASAPPASQSRKGKSSKREPFSPKVSTLSSS